MAARVRPPTRTGFLTRLGFGWDRRAAGPAHGRVILKPLAVSDWREWAKLRADSRDFLTPWESTWPDDALEAGAFRRRVRQYAEDWARRTAYHFLIRRAEDNRLVGGINITNVRRGIAQQGTLGYWIGAAHARHGYMTEAMLAMLGFAFGELKLHRVEAACLPDNAASRALLLKCGFREEGRARQYLRINGRWQDHVTFAILADDWAVRTDLAARGETRA